MKITSESRPRAINMRKNSTDHTDDTGILATASGYTTNASPIPDKQISTVENLRPNMSLSKDIGSRRLQVLFILRYKIMENSFCCSSDQLWTSLSIFVSTI